MSFGEILNRFFDLAHLKWRVLMGVSLLYVGGMVPIIAATTGPLLWRILTLTRSGVANPDFMQLAGSILPMLALPPLMLVLAVLYMPAAALVSLRANRDEPVTVGAAWAYGFAHFGRFFWLLLRQMLIIVLPMLGVAAVLLGGVAALIAWSTRGSGDYSAYMALVPLAILVYLGMLVYGIWLGVRFSLSSYAAVNEEMGAAQAMARSWQLTRDAFWRILGALVVVYLIVYAAQMVVVVALYFIAAIGVVIGIAAHAVNNPVLLSVLVGLGVTFYLAMIVLMSATAQAAFQAMLAILHDDQRRRVDFFAPPPIPPGAVPGA